ncbi:MAG: hypothetical protein AYK23_03005 [Candidatus Proteinoplasmatales archaeon SG8-5]|nr:MAG: hypothetical protein AYK23_03005 [Candidatus Proteinoplasmatales archaeon SG8-5]
MLLISPSKNVPDKAKWVFMAGFAIGCIFLYLYCTICRVTGVAELQDDRIFLDFMFRDLLGILPWFVWGCILAGFVMKYLTLGKLRLPKTMIGSGLFASVIPICSCAAVPMAHGMMLGRQMRVRSIITFLIVVPVLSPVVFILAIGKIGVWYLIVEIIAIFVLAMLTGIFIERLAGVKQEDDPGKGCYSCVGCKTAHMHEGRTSAMLASWDQLTYLMKYILMGIIIGSAISTMVEPSDLTRIFGGENIGLFQSIPGLVLIVLIAIPLFICSGEDVLIVAPLLLLGLPLGHAIAFAIAGNAICITAVPVLNATFGKKVTALIFLAFFVGSIALGLVINSIAFALG